MLINYLGLLVREMSITRALAGFTCAVRLDQRGVGSHVAQLVGCWTHNSRVGVPSPLIPTVSWQQWVRSPRLPILGGVILYEAL